MLAAFLRHSLCTAESAVACPLTSCEATDKAFYFDASGRVGRAFVWPSPPADFGANCEVRGPTLGSHFEAPLLFPAAASPQSVVRSSK